jgi:hypothetical protein
LDDLLSLGLDDIFNQQQNGGVSAAAGPSTSAQAFAFAQQQQNDPWSPRPSTAIPMMGGLYPVVQPAGFPKYVENEEE